MPCWLVEEIESGFYCDCPIGMKGKLCKHSIGLMYHTGIPEATLIAKYLMLQKRIAQVSSWLTFIPESLMEDSEECVGCPRCLI